MRISDWGSDVCSSDLLARPEAVAQAPDDGRSALWLAPTIGYRPRPPCPSGAASAPALHSSTTRPGGFARLPLPEPLPGQRRYFLPGAPASNGAPAPGLGQTHRRCRPPPEPVEANPPPARAERLADRKSTRLKTSH